MPVRIISSESVRHTRVEQTSMAWRACYRLHNNPMRGKSRCAIYVIAVSSLCAPPRRPSPRRHRAGVASLAQRLIAARVPYLLCWRHSAESSSRTTWSQPFERLRRLLLVSLLRQRAGSVLALAVRRCRYRRGFQALQISGPRALRPRRRDASATPPGDESERVP